MARDKERDVLPLFYFDTKYKTRNFGNYSSDNYQYFRSNVTKNWDYKTSIFTIREKRLAA